MAASDVTSKDGEEPSDQPKVFISYSRKDREKAQRISKVLGERNFGVFRDTDDILPTEEWRDRLEELIRQADTIVFLLSPHSAKSEVCAWEVELAYALEKRIAPIVIEDVEGSDIPPLLARLNFIFCTDRDPFEDAVDTMVSALNTDIDWIREHTRLAGLARRWEKSGRAGTLMLRGGDIAAAEAWRDTRPKEAPQVTPLQLAFIAESRRAAIRRQRMVAVGSVVGLIAAVTLSVFAWLQSVEAKSQLRAAQVNESRFLARRSVEMAQAGDHTAAAQVALMALPGEGGERPVTPAAESALRLALSNLTEAAYLPPLSGHQRVEAAISSNGIYAAQSDGANRIVVTDLRTMKTVIDREAPSWWSFFTFTPDGRFLQVRRRNNSSSNSGSMFELWDVEKGERLIERDTPIDALAPDGRTAVTKLGNSYDYRIVIIDVLTGQVKRVLAEQVQTASNFSFDATGEWLLMDGRVRIEDTAGWYVANLVTGEIRQLNPSNPMQIGEARWAAEGSTLITTVQDQGKPVFQFRRAPYHDPYAVVSPDFEGFVNSVTLSPDGRFIDFISDDEQVIMNIETGEEVRRFTEQRQITILPGSEAFAMYGGTLKGIEFHRLSPPGLLARVSTLGNAPQNFTITPDGRRLVSQGWDSSIQVWNIPEFVSRPLSLPNRFDSLVRDFEFTPDGAWLVAQGRDNGQVLATELAAPPREGHGTYLGGERGMPTRFLLDKLPEGRCPQERYLDILTEVRGIDRPADGEDQGWACPVAMALTPDGSMIIRLHARNDKFGVELQSTTGAFETAFLPVRTFAMNWIRFTRDGRFAVITPPRFTGNGGMVLIDLERRALVELEGIAETEDTSRTVVTSDNSRLIAPVKRTLKIWNIETGKIIGEVPSQGLKLDPLMGLRTESSYLFSDNRRLMLTWSSTGWIIDIETGEILVDDIAPGEMQFYDVSPDERLIAVGSYGEQEVRVWDLEAGAFVAQLTGMVTSGTRDENGITSVAFSPDGSLIAAGSANGRMRVWSYPRDLPGLIADTRDSLPRWMDTGDLGLFSE